MAENYDILLILTLSDEEVKAAPVLAGFYDLIALRLGLHTLGSKENHQYIFDCRNINIAQNIQDFCYDYFTEKGISQVDVTMALAMSGPKVDCCLLHNQVSVEAGYAKRALTVDVVCEKCGRKFQETYIEDGCHEFSDDRCYCGTYVPCGRTPTKEIWVKVMNLRGNTAALTNGQSCTIIDTVPDDAHGLCAEGLRIIVELSDGTQHKVAPQELNL